VISKRLRCRDWSQLTPDTGHGDIAEIDVPALGLIRWVRERSQSGRRNGDLREACRAREPPRQHRHPADHEGGEFLVLWGRKDVHEVVLTLLLTVNADLGPQGGDDA
jgi:hypothetical protein